METFRYFAYGSNMHTARLRARTPSAVALGTGYVEGHRLTFNKVSIDGSGKCDMESTNNATDRVWGVVFEISCDEEATLDTAEGLGHGYRKDTDVKVVMPTETFELTAYVATNKNVSLLPYHWYKAFVVEGAEDAEHRLPDEYIADLRSRASQEDPDLERRTRNQSLLQNNKSS